MTPKLSPQLQRGRGKLTMFDIGGHTLTALDVAGASGLLLGSFQFYVYVRMQYVSANMFGRIPEGSLVAELDAKDGKNIFYLPRNVEYTAIMASDPSGKVEKDDEKLKLDTQLVLESIGKANQNGLQLKGKVRRSTKEIEAKSLDCVISNGAIGRQLEGQPRAAIVREAYRMLRPGGLLVFVEPGRPERVIDDLQVAFQEVIRGGMSAGKQAEKAARVKRNRKGVSKGRRRRVLDEELESVKFTSAVFGMEEKEQEKEEKEERGEDVYSLPGDAAGAGGDDGPSSNDKSMSSSTLERPGITWERIPNFNILPFVTGIAVRP